MDALTDFMSLPLRPPGATSYDGPLLATLMASTNDGVIVTDADNRILTVNPAFTHVTGYTAAEAVGRKPSMLSSGRHGSAFYRDIWRSLLTRHQWAGEIWNRNKAGDIYLERLRIFRIADPQSGAVRHIAVFTDVTEHRRARSRAERQSRFDALTGLPNRSYFTDRLAQAMRDAARTGSTVGLIVLNIDNFRRINEHFGHAAGDRVLIAAARGLRGRLRPTELVSRLSGDEFAVMTPSRPPHQLPALARVLQQAVTAAGAGCGLGAPLTSSVGLAASPVDGTSSDMLLRHAAAAVDEAQKLGANRCSSFSSTASEQMKARLRIEAALRQAVRTKAFALAFQPRIDLRTGRLAGAEALIRWTDPVIGPVPPATFIPMAEELGLIEEIGGWVLEQVAGAAAAWKAANLPPIPFAANVSPLQLTHPGLAQHVAGLLDAYGLRPSDLLIEVTETALASDAGTARRTLSELRALGLTVALDDFGTGFATLASLRQLPADEIKIDRSFIAGMDAETEDAEIVRMVVALGGALDRAIVAEGVETAEQAEKLMRLGCQYGQGWLFGRPMPLTDLMRLDCSPDPAPPRPETCT